MKTVNPLCILILDDDEEVRQTLGDFFRETGMHVFEVSTPSAGFRIIERENIDFALVDLQLPEMDGLTFMHRLREIDPAIEVIIVTGHGDMDSAIDALRSGAADYFTKPFHIEDIRKAFERTKRFKELSERLRQMEIQHTLAMSAVKERTGCELIGHSKSIKKVINLMHKIAKSASTTVFITGESGTGKELVARGIHCLSNRERYIFHSVNCSAIPETLFESEFFGHVKGSFTGASETKLGWFEISNKGTLFLDEIGDMPLHLQSKFLRVLDGKSISKIGSHKLINLDVRVIAATNQDIEELVRDKRFRVDLFHRLNSFVIHVPPLREHPEDIEPLVKYFIRMFSQSLNKPGLKIEKEVINRLKKYHFPGNVRELKNMIERAVILCDRNRLLEKDLFFGINSHDGGASMLGYAPHTFDLEENEKKLIISALKATGYNRLQAAKLLNISWQTLDRRIKKFELSVSG